MEILNIPVADLLDIKLDFIDSEDAGKIKLINELIKKYQFDDLKIKIVKTDEYNLIQS